MEADIIVDGFLSSVEMYGVKYGVFVADGDSSVYSRILQARPYDDLTVEKVECTNHLLRNYDRKLRETVKNGKLGNIVLRQKIGNNILRLRNAVQKASFYRAQQEDTDTNQKVRDLRADILNSPYHIFGEHARCQPYYCKGSKLEEKNLVPEMKQTGLFQILERLADDLTNHTRSLLKHLNSNLVEQFFSVVAKFICGKRVNFTQRRSYQGRCAAAALSHNTKTPLYKLHKKLCNDNSPGKFTKLHEARRLRRIQIAQTKKTRRLKSKVEKTKSSDVNYGPKAEKPDLSPLRFEEKKKEFLDRLARSVTEIAEIERETILQSESGLWLEERRKLLTASNFGSICCRRVTTSCHNLVKHLLYSTVETDSVKYGRQHEKDAKNSLSEYLQVEVKECGLFIDVDSPYLGATPDGLINSNAVVEIKCPSSAANLTPEAAILSRKSTFWTTCKEKKHIVGVNKRHKHFFQIQGQLHITRRDICYYVLWTPLGMKVEVIKRDDEFWKREMEEKLRMFYMDCLLPELLDPRHPRSMPIRDPPYITEAQKFAENKKRPCSEDCRTPNQSHTKTRRKIL